MPVFGGVTRFGWVGERNMAGGKWGWVEAGGNGCAKPGLRLTV